MFRFSFLALTLALMAGCSVELKDKNEAAPAVLTAHSAASALFPLFALAGDHYRIETSGRPNDYRLALQPPAGTSITERIEQSGIVSARSWSLAFAFDDADVKPGHTYEYRFVGATNADLGRVRVTMPIDLQVNGDLDLTKPEPGAGTATLRRYRRVFLGAKTRLLTHDQSLEIQAEELYAEDGAKLMTFPPDTRVTKAGVAARSGGQLKLVVAKPAGFLRVEMRGEHAADGTPGLPFTDRAAAGVSPAVQPHRHCDAIGTGGPGTPGAVGRQGAPGGDGGNTGSFELVTDAALDTFKVDTVFEPGRFGLGGEGGPGQLGGLGGLSERRKFVIRQPRDPGMGGGPQHEIVECAVPADGAEAKPGDKGPKGPDGQMGAEGFNCRRAFAASCGK